MDRTVEKKYRTLAKSTAAVLAAVAVSASCGADRQQAEPVFPTVAEPTTKPTDGWEYTGGCDTMPSVWSQNVAEPWGAAERAEPSTTAEKVGSFKVNQKIPVVGWYDSGIASYPENPEPFEGRVWLKTMENTWVNTAGVRSKETKPREPGNAVELPMECEIVRDPQDQVVPVTP